MVMQTWTQFYATIGTAAAALLGLLFVVVSINVSVALGSEQVVARRLTEQAFQNYLAVMLVAFLALFPGISTTTFGMVTLIATASWSAWVVIRVCQTFALHVKQRSWRTPLRRHITSLLGFGILVVAAARMALNWGDSHNLFAASTLVLLFSATAVSWELLRRIANRSPG
jgi:hypothetical protein